MADDTENKGDADAASKPAEASATDSKSWFSTAARWQGADETIRTTSKWVVTTLTGFTGLIFASGGFLVKGEFGSDYFWQRTLAMLLGAALAAACLGGIIAVFAKALAPDEPSIGTLSATDLEGIGADQANFYPGDVETIDEFRVEYRLRELTALNARSGAQFAAAKRDSVKARLKDLDDRLADKDLDDGERALLVTRRQALPEELVNAELAASIWDRDASTAESNWEQFRATRDTILGQVRYRSVRTSFKDAGTKLVLLLVGLALGAALYTVAVSFKVDSGDDSDAASSTPQLATLTVAENEAGNQLWSAAGLDACSSSRSARLVSVQLTGGDGTESSPWKVSTIPSDTCQALSFSVISAAGTVVVPDPEEINITYGTETTTTTAGR